MTFWVAKEIKYPRRNATSSTDKNKPRRSKQLSRRRLMKTWQPRLHSRRQTNLKIYSGANLKSLS
jgi:hypothetical protein